MKAQRPFRGKRRSSILRMFIFHHMLAAKQIGRYQAIRIVEEPLILMRLLQSSHSPEHLRLSESGPKTYPGTLQGRRPMRGSKSHPFGITSGLQEQRRLFNPCVVCVTGFMGSPYRLVKSSAWWNMRRHATLHGLAPRPLWILEVPKYDSIKSSYLRVGIIFCEERSNKFYLVYERK